jgi:pimeloyl-ACP methyl ester carboxylesterase
MICRDRPGYGLSTLKKNYSPLDHARDVCFLMDDLGHRKYKVMGISGGAPFALALTYLAGEPNSPHTVQGTVLIAPATQNEASRVGQMFKRFLYELQEKGVGFF